MSSIRRLGRLATIVTAGWLLAGCDWLPGAVSTKGPIDRSLAQTYARMASGASLAEVAVVSSRLTTYGLERPGGSKRPPGASVWVLVLSGAFPIGSCRIEIPGFGSRPPSPRSTPCPAPAATERMLIDAGSGEAIEVIDAGSGEAIEVIPGG